MYQSKHSSACSHTIFCVLCWGNSIQ